MSLAFLSQPEIGWLSAFFVVAHVDVSKKPVLFREDEIAGFAIQAFSLVPNELFDDKRKYERDHGANEQPI